MKALDKIREVSRSLNMSGIEYAQREAGAFVCRGVNADTAVIFRDNPDMNDEQVTAVNDMVARRCRREPFHYIVGHAGFLGLNLLVGPDVLIPRPETEWMTERAMQQLTVTDDGSRKNLLDLCTGCGCIALALAMEFPGSSVFGTDISEAATACAEKNAVLNGIGNTTFLTGDLFQPVEHLFSKRTSHRTFDLIISNPPYVKRHEIATLQPEIREWEPLIALDGGSDGLDLYRRLIPSSGRFMGDNGLIMLEVGTHQAEEVADMLQCSGYSGIEVLHDFSGIGRVVQARWKK